jgi:hypothetical protein
MALEAKVEGTKAEPAAQESCVVESWGRKEGREGGREGVRWF